MKPNLEAMKAHLDFLFQTTPDDYKDGNIEIAWSAVATGAINSANYFSLDQINEAAQFCFDKNIKEGVNVYVGAALRRPDIASCGRSNSGDYYGSNVVWVDIDDAHAAAQAKENYKDLPPSMVVVTGRNPETRFQAWWRLNDFIINPSELRASLAGLKNAMKSDPAVVDPSRIMRVGGSVAWPKKPGRVTELTEINKPERADDLITIGKLYAVYKPSIMEAHKDYTTINDGKPRNKFTGTIEITAILEQSRKEGCWHFSMRDAIAAMVSKNWSDEQIRIATTPYLRDRSLIEDLIGPLIASARKKWEKPDPETQAHYNDYNTETGEIIQKNKFFYINGPDIAFDLNTNDFVQNTLCDGAMSVVYGESNCGKTFFMTNLAFHIVEGMPWNEKRVEKGNVLYISLEGSGGLKRRVEAFKREKNATLNGFLMMPCAVDFLSHGDSSDINALLDVITEAKNSLGEIKLIVIDTLARAMGGGDENSGQDMGLLVKHADFIKEHTGAHICFIHHSGKDKARGARGHSSLRAAVDTEIEIGRKEGADYSEVKIVKQRDMDMGEPSYFKLKSIELGVNKHNEPVKSCIVEPYNIEENTNDFVKTHIKSGKTRTAFDALIECLGDKGTLKYSKDLPSVKITTEQEFKDYLVMRGVLSENNKSANIQYQRIKNDLIEHNLAVFRDLYVWSGR